MLVRIAIDFEHPSRRWWENGGQELWDALLLETPGESHVVVDESLAKSWVSQASSIEGWHDGPEYAPHPLTVQPVDDDADV